MKPFECAIKLKKDKDKIKETRNGKEFPLFLYVKIGANRTYVGITKLITSPLKSFYTEEDFAIISSKIHNRIFSEEQIKFSELERDLYQMIRENHLNSLEEVKEFFKSKGKEALLPPQEACLGLLFDLKIQEKEKKGKSQEEYRVTKLHIDRYIRFERKKQGIDSFPIRNVGKEFVDGLRNYLEREPINKDIISKSKKPIAPKYRKPATINSYLREFRAVLKQSKIECDKWFTGIDRQIAQVSLSSIRNHELKRLLEYNTTDERKRWAVNITLLTYFCLGANMIDLILLKSNYAEKVDPNRSLDYYFEFTRNKTKDTAQGNNKITVYLDTKELSWLLEYFTFNPGKEEAFLFDLAPPHVDLKSQDYHTTVNSKNASVLANYWNKIARKYLLQVSTELGIERKINLKVTRLTAINKVFSFELEGGLAMITAGHTTTQTGRRNYRELETRIADARVIFNAMLKSARDERIR